MKCFGLPERVLPAPFVGGLPQLWPYREFCCMASCASLSRALHQIPRQGHCLRIARIGGLAPPGGYFVENPRAEMISVSKPSLGVLECLRKSADRHGQSAGKSRDGRQRLPFGRGPQSPVG